MKFRKRVLVIDDEEANREAVVEALSDAGYQAILSPDWESAQGGLEAMEYDVAAVEIFMKGKGGIHAIEELRRRAPAIRIIAMAKAWNGITQTESLRAAGRIGADLTLAKPVAPEAVVEAVRSLVGEPSVR